MTRLQRKRILITGASSGIGLAAVERFAREGADLALLARGAAALDEAAAVGREHGAVVHTVAADLADRAAAEAAVADAVAALGGLDVLVSNAGAVAFGHFLEVPAEDFDRTVAVTFTGAVNAIRAALPALRASRGVIVATSSIMAKIPLPAFSSYTAAKHALRGFLDAVRIEEREQRSGVRVALVAPGPTDTPIYARATSGTGLAPAILPDAYHADEVAEVLVEAAVNPRRERIVGGESRLVATVDRHARPVTELVLLFVDRWFRTGTIPSEVPGALWAPMQRARVGGGLPGRAAGDLVSLGGNLAGAAKRAWRTAPGLLRPVPETQPARAPSGAGPTSAPARQPSAAAANDG